MKYRVFVNKLYDAEYYLDRDRQKIGSFRIFVGNTKVNGKIVNVIMVVSKRGESLLLFICGTPGDLTTRIRVDTYFSKELYTVIRYRKFYWILNEDSEFILSRSRIKPSRSLHTSPFENLLSVESVKDLIKEFEKSNLKNFF